MKLRSGDSQKKTLFVTVGSTQFDKLVDQVLKQDFVKQLSKLGFGRMIVQAGKSDYDPKLVKVLEDEHDFDIQVYDYKSSILEDAREADLIIGHAGAGTCIEMLRLNKRLLIVVNDSLMDNHQAELADQLDRDKYAIKVTSMDELASKLELICDLEATKLNPFPSKDQSKFEQIFDDELKKVVSRL